MGLRTPQQMPRVAIKKSPGIRFSGTVAPEIDTGFIDVASKAIEANRVAEEKKRADQLSFIKKSADIDADELAVMAKAELTTYKGVDASNKSITIREKLRRQLDEKLKKIPVQFQPYIEQIHREKMVRYNKTAIPYTLGELDRVRDATEKTFVNNSMRETVEASGNPYEFSAGLAKVAWALEEKARKSFGNVPSLINEAKRIGISKTIVDAVQQQAVMGRLDNAENLLEFYNDDITPSDRVKALKHIDTNRNNIETINAEGLATQASEIEDPAAQEAFIRNNTSSHTGYTSAMATLRSINKAKTARVKYFDGKVISEINKDLSEGKPLDAIKLNAIQDPKVKNKLIDDINRYGGIENRITDKKVYKELVTKLFHNREAFKKENLESYQIFLSPNDYKFLTDKQTELIGKENDRQEKIDYSTDKLVQDLAKDHIKTLVDSGKVTDDQVTELYTSMMEFQDRLVRQSRGMSERDIRRVFAERISRYAVATEKAEAPFWSTLIPLGPQVYKMFADDTVAPNTYIPIHDHTEEEIEKVREKTQWETDKILRFLDGYKTR